MSDEEDNTAGTLAEQIAVTYTMIRIACLGLPVPITLPGLDTPINDKIEAVGRMVDLAEEQPMPEEIQAALGVAGLTWITALDMISLGLSLKSDARGLAGVLALKYFEDAITEVAVWVHENP